ncbi:MAG: DnaK suppressor protein [Gammaproteobacteria bacterium]|nr:DnaK suppressor protein [Gammaproteobacteria bacterium]
MTNQKTRLDPAYLHAKRSELMGLRSRLQGTRAGATAEEADVNAEASGEAREYEDDAQKLTTLELEGTLEVRDTHRLVNVERALRKIEEGTYGLSDASGEPIPIERLDAVPEAIYTLAEQSALDEKR